MDAVTYFKEKKRLTDSCGIECDDCRLCTEEMMCGDMEEKCPEKAVKIVERWSKECPVETYGSVFLKAFPKEDVNQLCVEYVFGIEVPEEKCDECAWCWNQQYGGE